MRRNVALKSLLTAVPFVVYAVLSIQAATDRAARCVEAGAAACDNEGFAALDEELGRLYRLARQGAGTSSARVQALVEEQQEWLRDRNECWKARDPERCVVEQYAKRIHQLRHSYVDARSHDWAGISAGPMEMSCEAGPTARLTTVRGDPDVAYLELSHSRVVLTGGPTHTGQRYVAQTNEGEYALSSLGGRAVLERPGAPDDHCRIVETDDNTELAQIDQPT